MRQGAARTGAPQESVGDRRHFLRGAREEPIPVTADQPVALAPLTAPPSPLITHIHAVMEVGILLTGEHTRVSSEGLERRLAPGDVWMIPMWEPHGWAEPCADAQRVVVEFMPDFLGGEMIGDTFWMAGFAASPNQRPQVHGKQMRERVMGIARELWQEAHERQYGWAAAVRGNLLRLFATLYRTWQRPGEGAGDGRRGAYGLVRVMPVVEAVRQQPGRLIGVTEAARLCNLSRRQFHRLFSQTMGVAFRDFCLWARLARAEQLLISTNLPIGSVASLSGFADSGHLHRQFVKHYGCSPGAYRARIR